MQTVINHLNAVIEDRMPTALKPEPCRKALFAIETQQLAVTALRLLVDNTGDFPQSGAFAEARAHSQRFLELHDKQMAERVAAQQHQQPPMDASDLA